MTKYRNLFSATMDLEANMNKLQENLALINNEIINDPLNIVYTHRGIKPLYTVDARAKILIIGQAPGEKAQNIAIPFLDKSGDTLRDWLGVSKEVFYDPSLFAIVPMDFYFPGKGQTGDLPPRPFFSTKYHARLFANMPHIQLIILIGTYAQKYYLGKNYKKTLTATVAAFKDYLPTYFPLVHPSPLNFRWFNKNPWFTTDVLPVLKTYISTILSTK